MSYYFKGIENKYNPLLSFKNPVVIKAYIQLDNRDIKLNAGAIKEIDFIVRKITKDISYKYKCFAFSIFNEINIVLNNPQDLALNGKLESHSLVSLFSQEIFMRYNELSFGKKINFVSVNVFNIFEEKIKPYIFNRQSIGFNNYVSMLGSKLFSYNQVKNKSREEILEIIEIINPSLLSLKKYIREGYASLNGKEIDIYEITNFKDIDKLVVATQEELIINFKDDIEEDL